MTEVQKHFVEFYSPGMLFSEQTELPIESWDVEMAVKMADDVIERHGATPFAFRFTTRGRGPDDLDSREIAHSHRYFLGGVVETLEEIEQRNDPNEAILRSNMRHNNWPRIVRNTNSYTVCIDLRDDDVILEYVAPRDRSKQPAT